MKGRVNRLIENLHLVILIERYCTLQVPLFVPGAKIVSVDGDTLRAANGVECRFSSA